MGGNWAFRVASTPEVGGGHMMRSLALARILHQTASVHFFLCPGGERWIESIERHGIRATIGITIDDKHFSNCVVDGYNFTDSDIRTWRSRCDRLVFIDDYGQAPNFADVVISTGVSNYECRTKAQTVLAGIKYTLLSPEYSSLKNIYNVDHVRNVLVACGMRDSKGCTANVLSVLSSIGFHGSVTVAIGSTAPHLDSIKATISSYGFSSRIVIDADGLFCLLNHSDVVIGSGGLSLFERMALGKPSVTVVTADNQLQQAQWAGNIGATTFVNGMQSSCRKNILGAIDELLSSQELRQTMRNKGMSAIDGKGAERVTNILLGNGK